MTPEKQAIQERLDALPRIRWAIGCLAAFLGGVAGFVTGAYIGSAFAPQTWSGLGDVVTGAIIGFFVGLIVAVVLTWAGSTLLDRRRRRIPF
jgi:hypothetical protein